MKGGRKQVCVIGLGAFGAELARQLAQHCDVLALDTEPQRVAEVRSHVQQAMVMDARDFDSLSSVVDADFDEVIIGLGGSLEPSILCTLHLRKIGVKSIRCKALDNDHKAILEAVGANEVFFPEREMARRLATRIVNPNLLDYIPLAEPFRVVEVLVPKAFAGQSLLQLELRKRYGMFVVGVRHAAATTLHFLPGPDYVFKAGDVATMIGSEKDLARFQAAVAEGKGRRAGSR